MGRMHAGFFFGRTPLIALSPKKTWEGFVGGALLTLVASWYLARYMSRFPWMICERNVSVCSVPSCAPSYNKQTACSRRAMVLMEHMFLHLPPAACWLADTT